MQRKKVGDIVCVCLWPLFANFSQKLIARKVGHKITDNLMQLIQY